MEEARDNNQHGNWRKSQARKRLFSKHNETKKKAHFASLMDICHLKNAELEPKLQKYQGRVVFRGDIVKEDSRAHAVFTELGSSAFQMIAAKVMDVIAGLPDCDGQAADSVSAYTQGGRSQMAQNSKVRMSRCLDTSSTTQMAKIMEKH